MKDGTFIQLARLQDSEKLRYLIKKDHNAFILLTVIASRARRSLTPDEMTGLCQMQAHIGDHENYGMTLKEYRTAKKRLEKYKIVATKGTNKGTIATLLDSTIYDINPEEKGKQVDTQGASKGQARGKQGATNNNDNNDNNDKKENKEDILSSKPDKKEVDPRIKEVVEYLNLKTGKNYSPKAAHTKHISARLKEGYSIAELKRVIDVKVKEWLGGQYAKYLRPQTLFNTEKFDQYLNQEGICEPNKLAPNKDYNLEDWRTPLEGV